MDPGKAAGYFSYFLIFKAVNIIRGELKRFGSLPGKFPGVNNCPISGDCGRRVFKNPN